MVLSLRSLFEQQRWTTNQTWMIESFRNARNSSLGFLFEEAALLVLVEIFGGKFNALGNAFHCSGLLGSRRVTLVSLKRGVDGSMRSSPVSWNAGSSDRFVFKARSPSDVLAFLDDPDGKAFLFPDTLMGFDVFPPRRGDEGADYSCGTSKNFADHQRSDVAKCHRSWCTPIPSHGGGGINPCNPRRIQPLLERL